MPLKDNDIVYILKDEMDTDELRYSLRSVAKNFPHRYVWFVGGQPKGFKPDRFIKHKQEGSLKWELIRSSMYKAVENEELSDEFFLFNDDFFIMKQVRGEWTNFVDMTIAERIAELRKEFEWLRPYGRTLYKAEQELISLGAPTMNFEVHLPMLFEKSKVIEALKQCSSPQMRSVYGNITRSPFVIHPDVKVYDNETVPKDPDFLSTNDKVFTNGKVGEYIRAKFPKPCKYEGEG